MSGVMQAKGQLWAWHIEEYAPEIREIIAAAVVVVVITVVRVGCNDFIVFIHYSIPSINPY